MGTLTFSATLGGAVNLVGPNTANTTTFTLPSSDGTTGQALITNGSGALAFQTLAVSGGGTGVTSSTGSGSVVLSTSPTLVTPVLGTPTSATLTNATGLPLSTGVTGTLAVSKGGTGATTLTANYVLLGNGTSAIQTVAPSNSGNVLTSNGTNWISAIPGNYNGPMSLISTQTVSSTVTSIDFTGLTGDVYMLIYEGITTDISGSGSTVNIRLGTGSTPTYLTSGYRYGKFGVTDNGTSTFFSNSTSASGNIGYLSNYGMNYTNSYASGQFLLTNMLATNGNAAYIFGNGIVSDTTSTGVYSYETCQNVVVNASAKTAIRILLTNSAKNIVLGKVSLYSIST